MVHQNLIKDIVNTRLCTGCGTCIGICPNNAIILIKNKRTHIYVPKINKEQCNSCGLCYKVCPGYPFKYKILNLNVFKKKPNNYLIGNFEKCYVGHSENNFVRYNAASGGLITQLLIFALEQKIIDGALITKMNKDSPLEPEPFIARTREQIIEASKSIYCPVPLNIALKQVLNSKKNEKFAIVGLPCQIHGIRMAEKINRRLKEKIILHFGIFCSHTLNFNGTRSLLKILNIKKTDITKIDYRGEGWPGKMKITLKGNQQKLISNDDPLWERIFHCGFFIPHRCLLCHDLTNELSDISFGDAWLPEIVNQDHIGKSIIISRNKIGNDLLEKANSSKTIDISEIRKEKVFQSQKMYLYIKKINIFERIRLSKFIKYTPIKISKKKIRTNLYDKLFALFSLFTSLFGSLLFKLSKNTSAKTLKRFASTFYYLNYKTTSKLKIEKGINILILHAHWNNRGDEAALLAMIESLKSELPIKNIKILFMEDEIKYFPYDDINFIDRYPRLQGNYSFIDVVSLIATSGNCDFSTLIDILLILFSRGKRAFSKRGKRFLKDVNDADVVIHAPGGPMIGELFGKYEFPYLFRIFISILKKKPTFIYAPSIGPFTKKIRNIFRKFILKRIDSIILRDEFSRNFLKEQLGINAYLTIDSCLQHDILHYSLNHYDNLNEILNVMEREKVIGMTLTDLRWHPFYMNNQELRRKIKKSLHDAVKYFIDNGYFIVLIPQIFGFNFEKPLLDAIKSINSEKILILPENVDSYGQQIIISKLYCLIGMRYHPNIFAAKVNTPSIAICYGHKAIGFMKKCGRSDLTINIEEISSNIIIKKFMYLKENYDRIKKEIIKKIPLLKNLSKKTTEIIRERLKEKHLV